MEGITRWPLPRIFPLSRQCETPPLGGGGGAVVYGNLNVSREIFVVIQNSAESDGLLLDLFTAGISKGVSQDSRSRLGLRGPDLPR